MSKSPEASRKESMQKFSYSKIPIIASPDFINKPYGNQLHYKKKGLILIQLTIQQLSTISIQVNTIMVILQVEETGGFLVYLDSLSKI
jgi:hypothetical protein